MKHIPLFSQTVREKLKFSLEKKKILLRGILEGVKFGPHLKEIENLSKHFTPVCIGRDSLPVASYLKKQGVKRRFLPVSGPCFRFYHVDDYWDFEAWFRRTRTEVKKSLKNPEKHVSMKKIMDHLKRIHKGEGKPLLLIDAGAIGGSQYEILGEVCKSLRIPFAIYDFRHPEEKDPLPKSWKIYSKRGYELKPGEIRTYEESIPMITEEYVLPGVPKGFRRIHDYPRRYKLYKAYAKGFWIGARYHNLLSILCTDKVKKLIPKKHKNKQC